MTISIDYYAEYEPTSLGDGALGCHRGNLMAPEVRPVIGGVDSQA